MIWHVRRVVVIVLIALVGPMLSVEAASDGTVDHYQKISDTAGNCTAILNDQDYFGRSVAGIGDLDGDGVLYFAVSASRDDDGGTDRGAVYVLFLASILPSKGDVNRDGLIDLLDARLCLQIAQGYIIPTEAQQAAADVDGDVDLTDAEILSEYIIGIRSALP